MSGKKSLYNQGLSSLSTVDGREVLFTAMLQPYLSEGALHRHRAIVMIQNMVMLSESGFPGFPRINEEIQRGMDIILSEDMFDATIVAEYDHFGRNGIGPFEHDVKAVEFYLREKFDEYNIAHLKEWIHFPMTSEDCSNIGQNLMFRNSINNVWLPKTLKLCNQLASLSKLYAATPVPGKTHGMNASPTTFGKRFAYFLDKCTSILYEMSMLRLSGKWGGAVGNNNAIFAVFPEFDIQAYAVKFVESFGFVYKPVEHQRNSHLSIVAFLQKMNVLHTILIDLCQHLRLSIMMDWFVQKPQAQHVGSSVMPHKVNPWRFEVAEGYFEQARALIDTAVPGLIESLFERDASDHPWERAYGEIFGKSLTAISYIIEDLSNISINEEKALQDLEGMPEVVTEAIQIAGRRCGVKNIYMHIKEAVRGKKVTLSILHEIIDGYIPDKEIASRLKALLPQKYTGNAEAITLNAILAYDSVRSRVEKGLLRSTTGILAVLFDLDNTLHFGDKEELYQRLLAITKALGMDFSEDELRIFGKKSDYREIRKSIVETHNKKGGVQHTEDLFQKENDRVTGTLDHYFKLAEGTEYLLKLLREKGYMTGLVTTRGKQSSDRVIKLHGIEHLFDVVINRDSCDEKKPHPKPISLALERLGIKGCEAMFVGDKQLDDVIAGNALHMQTVLINTEPLDPHGAIPKYHFDSLQKLIALFKE